MHKVLLNRLGKRNVNEALLTKYAYLKLVFLLF